MLTRVLLGGILLGMVAIVGLPSSPVFAEGAAGPAAPAPEVKQKVGLKKCPHCKEKVTATKKGGGITLEKEMTCPKCKGKGTSLSPHVCDMCGGEVLLCPKCNAVVASVAAEKPEAPVHCPSCKELMSISKKGGSVTLEKSMHCPACKGKLKRLELHTCAKCGAQVLLCPHCKQPQ